MRILFPLLLLLTLTAGFLLALAGRPMISPRDLLPVAESTSPHSTESFPMSDAETRCSLEAHIFWTFRLPRTLLALIAGAGLALAGVVLQAVFRNPLATPYTLGIASGASFGATVFMQYFGASSFLFLGLSGVSWAAFGGALLSMAVVFLLAGTKQAGNERMLLGGVAVNFFFSSLILFLQYVSDAAGMLRIIRWTMGGLDFPRPTELVQLGCIVAFMGILLFFLSRELNILVTGRQRAISLGVNVDRLRTLLFVLSSLMVGAIVSICGPIGFVGLMVPHLCRLLVGPDHRRLVPVSFLVGGLFLACCDTIARSLFTVGDLPVGILTSLLGGPFFLWILVRSR